VRDRPWILVLVILHCPCVQSVANSKVSSTMGNFSQHADHAAFF
jgi:hypothetical protein